MILRAGPFFWHDRDTMAFNLENLKIENNSSEIVTTLIRMYRESSPVLVWQNSDEGRVMKNSFIREIYPEKRFFVLTTHPDSSVFNFCQSTTIYLRGNERSILFKQKDIVVRKNKVIVKFPTEVRLYEKRFHQRFHYGFKSNHAVEIFHPKSTMDSEEIFNFSLYDISEKGASFNLNLADQRYFFQGDKIKILRLGKKCFKQYFTGKIIYMNRTDYKINGVRCPSIKMGIHFDQRLTSKLLAQIKGLHT